jgi:hypothetical protein
MSFQHPFRLSSNTPSNAFQRPTVTPPIPPWALEGAPLEDGAPNAGRGRGRSRLAKWRDIFRQRHGSGLPLQLKSHDLLSGAHNSVTC